MTDDTSLRIQRYYIPEPEKEWRRLDGLDTGPIEFELTTRQIARRLKPRSRVLDIGGLPLRFVSAPVRRGRVQSLPV